VKTARPVEIADHLWELFGRMAEEMGSERDALVNQAMHLYARLHGFTPPGGPDLARALAPPAAGRLAVAEQVLEAAERLERALTPRAAPPELPGGRDLPPPPEPRALAAAPSGRTGCLVLLREDGAEVEVRKDRFVVGRGRHCDLVIDSGKISREHAAFVREGDGWIGEDLGSANGTWYQKARVRRRAVVDGDELFVSAERITCRLK
jgi:hypothetical protein